jgi:CxxC motif-containing protein (DUF1111 family)
MTPGARRRSLAWLPAWAALMGAVPACGGDGPGSGPGAPQIPEAALLGGDTTVFDDGDEALVHPLRNLSADYRGPFQIGDGVFNRNWVSAPATPVGRDGLGPTYNATSCSGCHDNNGRGATPEGDEPFLGLLLRLGVGGTNEHGGPKPDPVYGDQLQPYAILGVSAEATPRVAYAEQPGTYADGQAYGLRAPTYTIVDPKLGPLADGILISPRLAPQMVGLGLLEAVDEATIEAFAATNGGHTNHVWDVAKQATALGRFGWKANQPTLAQQTFAAFRNDIGITSALFPDKNCGPTQTDCLGAPMSLTTPNIQDPKADAMVVHAMALAVPARRNLDDAQALLGQELFGQIGCGSCHIQKMVTGVLADWPELSNQTIHPYTDLLLHDMGEGLADGRPDFEATGREWRTPPLWGLGLSGVIDGYLFLLHDGRARDFAEAILWHGGQAEAASESFRNLPKSDRDALVAFLQSL